jgi:putative transport protein
MRKYFGDSIKGTQSSATSRSASAWRSASHGDQLPLPASASPVGLAGVLIMALILGRPRRTGGMN